MIFGIKEKYIILTHTMYLLLAIDANIAARSSGFTAGSDEWLTMRHN